MTELGCKVEGAAPLADEVLPWQQRRRLLERDAQISDLAGKAVVADPMDQLLRHSITYRIAVGPQQGCRSRASRGVPHSGERLGSDA